MNRYYTLIGVFLVFIVPFVFSFGWNNNQAPNAGGDAMLLDQIKVLTFEENKRTNARRVSAIPQLQCIGGNARGSQYQPNIVQCHNMGSDGYDVQWKCEAELNGEVRFGKTEVSCEGYGYPDDPYVLRGSCGLEYTLEYTNPQKQNQNSWGGNSYGNNYGSYDSHKSSWSVGGIIMFIIVCFIIYGIVKQCMANQAGAVGGGNDGYGPGYGGDGTNNNGGYPPSGGSYPGYPKTDPYASSSSSYNTGYPQPRTNTYQPGFWSGMGGGGLLGYLLGRSSSSGYGGYNRGYGYGSAPRYSSGFGSGGFGSGFGGGSGGFGGGSSTRTSSGFGGTRRR